MDDFKINKIGKVRLKKLIDTHKKTAEETENLLTKNLFTDTKTTKKISIMTKKGVNLSIFISIGIILALCFVIFKVFAGMDFKTLMISAGDDLKTDINGHTNVLILGTGIKGHDGADLTDSMIIASLDQNKKIASLISIPRDFWIKDPITGGSRINQVYFSAKERLNSSSQGLDYLSKKIEEITGLQLQYYIKIDFNGFKNIIDIIGGVDINVPEPIYDPFYPKGETGFYEIFSMSKGEHHMDGETALKYARSRETSSDFSRSNRQQLIIYAAKEKAMSANVFLDQSKLQELFNAVKENLETNLTIKEILTLGGILGDFKQENISNKLIHDDPIQCGGFLYQPPMDEFGGAFVLLPAGNKENLTRYFDLITNSQLALKENLKIQILNGTTKGGVAAETKQVLQRYCFDISRFGNAPSKDIIKTTIYYKMLPLPKENPQDETEYYKPYTVEALKTHFFPMAGDSTEIPQKYIDLGYDKTSDIILEIGSDYVSSDKYIEDPFYALYSIIYQPPKSNSATDTSTSTSSTTNTTPATDLPSPKQIPQQTQQENNQTPSNQGE